VLVVVVNVVATLVRVLVVDLTIVAALLVVVEALYEIKAYILAKTA